MKVLVVDDDPVQRGVISKMLMADGNDVIEADSGEAAVAAVQSAEALSLILMDLRMPGMSGEEALDRIRALPGWRGQVPIKAMSAASLTAKEQAAFDGFLQKGSDIARLLGAAVTEARSRAAKPTSDEQTAFLSWLRQNWQLTIALVSLVGTGIGWLNSATATGARFEYRLAQLELSSQRGEARDSDNIGNLKREIIDQGKRMDSRIQEIFVTLNNAIGEAAKHADAHEMEIFTSLNKDISDVAGRIDAQDRRFTELRHIRDAEQSGMLQRIAVLESQVKFFGEHIDVSTRVPSPVSGKRQ